MTQLPPPPPGPASYTLQQPRRGNGIAIASLVCGILQCIPGIGLLAILFGFLGLRNAKAAPVGGKGLAIAGLVLGLLNVLGWSGFGAATYYGIKAVIAHSQPYRYVADSAFRDLATGDINAAQNQFTSNVSPAQVAALSATLQPLGQLQSTSFSNTSIQSKNGRVTCKLGGTAYFVKGNTPFTVRLVAQNGAIKIDSLKLE